MTANPTPPQAEWWGEHHLICLVCVSDMDWTDCHDCGGGECRLSACWDDLCYGTDHCIHGDDMGFLPCQTCDNAGGWWECIGCHRTIIHAPDRPGVGL